MKNTYGWGTSKGFALPSVLIASVVMLIVLLSGLVSASSANTALRQQYYSRLNKEAVESGYARAQSCLNIYGKPTWSTASPLRPDSSCTGGVQCNTGPTCYVLSNTSLQTTFTVNSATQNSDGSYNIPVVGEVIFLRTGGTVNTSLSLKDDRPLKTRMGWKVIASGTSHSCGVTINNNVYCWGYGGSSGIGNGKTNPSSVTVPYPIARGQIPYGVSFISVSSNNSWSSHCALGSDGEAYCWGSNAYGQLGNGNLTDSNTPVQVLQGAVPAGVTFTSVQVGFYHACALGSDSKVYCWGRNNYGQFGNNTTTDSSTPVLASAQGAIPAGVTAKAIKVGFYTSCIIGSNNWIYCWGYNMTGQFGNGSESANSSVPVAIAQGAVPNGVGWKDLDIGTYHNCGIATNDKAYCWGDTHNAAGNYWALGNGTTTMTLSPGAVAQGATPVGATWRFIAAGDNVSCGIASDNKAYCWGLNGLGSLGNNTTTNANAPVAVSQGDMPSPTTTLVGISLGDDTPCALDSLGIGYCWGDGGYGKLANGAVSTSTTPNALIPSRMRTPTEQGLQY